MEKFKIENFCRDNPSLAFPEIRTLDESECAEVRSKLLSILGLSQESRKELLIKWIDEKGELVPDFSAEEEGFKLQDLFSRVSIEAKEKLFINWYKFDSIDQVGVADLNRFFEYFWYPSSDDIDLFDDSYTWVLSIDHSGGIKKLSYANQLPQRD